MSRNRFFSGLLITAILACFLLGSLPGYAQYSMYKRLASALDISWATGGSGVVETFSYTDPTSGLALTLPKVDASYLKFRAVSGAVEDLINGLYTLTLKAKEYIVKGPEVDARAYGSASQATIIAALADIGSKQKTLVIYPNLTDTSTTWALTDDQIIPSNVLLKVSKGAILSIDATKTLTINGGFSAGDYQVFTCTGTGRVKFGSVDFVDRARVPLVNPLWFGAKGDNVTDDGAAFQLAFDSAPATAAIVPGGHGITIEVPPGSYYINTQVNVTQNSSMVASGPRSQTNFYIGAGCTNAGFYCHAAAGEGGDGTTFHGLCFTVTAPKYAIYATSWPSLYIYDCWFIGGRHIYLDGTSDIQISRNTFDGGDYHIKTGANDNADVRITNNLFFKNTTISVDIDAMSKSIISDNVFSAYYPVFLAAANSIRINPTTAGMAHDITISTNQFYTYLTSTIQSYIMCYNSGYLSTSDTLNKNIKILNNTFRGNASFAVRCVDGYSDGMEVCGNTIDLSSSTVAVAYPITLIGYKFKCNLNNIKSDLGASSGTITSSLIYAGGPGTNFYATPSGYGQVIGNTLHLYTPNTKTVTSGFLTIASDYMQVKNNTCLAESVGGTLTVTQGINALLNRTGISALLNPMYILGTAVLNNWVNFTTATDNDKILAHGSVAATVNPPSIAATASAEQDVTIPGVALGDRLLWSPGIDTAGMMISATITAANTVTIVYYNRTATNPLDLASSTWNFEWYR